MLPYGYLDDVVVRRPACAFCGALQLPEAQVITLQNALWLQRWLIAIRRVVLSPLILLLHLLVQLLVQ